MHRPADRDTIPVIDITALRDGSDPMPAARALHDASRDLGFIYVRGHGIDPAVIEAARASAYAFFRSDPEEKACVAVSASHRGWLATGGARMHDDAQADYKESFIWGYQDDGGQTPIDHPLRGANRWPHWLPALSDHAMAFFHSGHAVARHLLRGFALALGLDENFFMRQCDRPLSRASFVYYPHQGDDVAAGRYGVAPHTDFGVLTVLCQDDVGGLEVCDAGGKWIQAPPVDDTLVVNVGDLLSRWTGGAYRSTPHRVLNRSGRERLSLVLAFDPDPETIIDPRQIHGANHDGAPPTTCGDYLVWRFDKAFAYRTAS